MKKIKMVERGGVTAKDILTKTNPWSEEGCERSDCLPCRGERGKGGNCQKENVVYRVTCQECAIRQVKAEYTGETSRTAYLRGREHWDGLEKEQEKNALWKHCVEEHGGNKVTFSMKVLRSHKAALSRQVHESVEIECSKAKYVLNSKGEWNGSRIPRIRIEVGEELEEDEDDTLAGTSNKVTKGKWPGGNKSWSINNQKKRRSENESEEPARKRRRAEKSSEEQIQVRKDDQETGGKKRREVRKDGELSGERKLMESWLTKSGWKECGNKEPECGQAEPHNSENGKDIPELAMDGPVCGNDQLQGPECGRDRDKSDKVRPECDQAQLSIDRPECDQAQQQGSAGKVEPECGRAQQQEAKSDSEIPRCNQGVAEEAKEGPGCGKTTQQETKNGQDRQNGYQTKQQVAECGNIPECDQAQQVEIRKAKMLVPGCGAAQPTPNGTQGVLVETKEKVSLQKRKRNGTKRYKIINEWEELKTSGNEHGCGKTEQRIGRVMEPVCCNQQGCGTTETESKLAKEWWKQSPDRNINVKPGKALQPEMGSQKTKIKIKRKKITSKGGNKDGKMQKITMFFENLNQEKIEVELGDRVGVGNTGGGEVAVGRVGVGGDRQVVPSVGIKTADLQTVPASGGTVGGRTKVGGIR